MTPNLVKDFLREIKKTANRFISILCIVAIGVAFFVGLKSAAPDMMYTMDNYFDDYNIMDIRIASTLGLTQEDIDVIAATPGVKKVQPGYFTDATTTVGGSEIVFRINSLPADYTTGRDGSINQLKIVDGRLPEAENEIIVEKETVGGFGINLGDVLTMKYPPVSELEDDPMKVDTFTVVGFAITPYYLTYEKGNSELGGKAINLFAYVPEDCFAYEDMYLEALVTIEGAMEKNAFTDKYASFVGEMTNQISNIGVDQAIKRGDSLRDSANEQLDEAQKKYDEGYEEFTTEIAKAEKELEDGRTELIRGEEQLAKEKEKYEIEVRHAEEEIAAGEKELAEARTQIAEGEKQLAEAQTAYDQARTEFDQALAENQENLDNLKKLEQMMAETTAAMEQLEGMLGTGPDDQSNEFTQNLYDSYKQLLEQQQSSYNQIKKANEDLDTLINTLEQALQSTEETLNKSRAELAEAKRQYNEGVQQLNAGKAELAQKKKDAEEQFAEAQKTIDEGWKEYEEGVEKLEKERAEGQKELDEANRQLIEARVRVDMIDNAEWYVLDRTTNYGFVSYKSTVDRMDALSQIMPVFFILVAVLVCMTTMTRMVSEQRGTIGTYKALGYDDNAIALKYVLYVLTASIVGTIIGSVLGELLFPRAVYNAWAAMYSQPAFEQTVHIGVIIISIFVSVVAMSLTAYYTCQVELNSVPAQLMRPKAPKLGKAIFLEHMPAIWDNLNFSQKVTARNIFRYKKRLFMTIIGIMGCSALLLSGLGMNDTVSKVVSNQFGKVFRYDISLSTTEDVTDEQKEALEQVLEDSELVDSYAYIGAGSMTLSRDNVSETATVYITEDPAGLPEYIRLAGRTSDEMIPLTSDGIIVTEKLADQLSLSVGDMVDVVCANIAKKIPVIGITENYVFHYVYITQECYESYFWEKAEQNGLFVNLRGDVSSEEISGFCEELAAMEGLASVQPFTELAEDFAEQITAMQSIIVLIIGCAALLAFVVLYNLTNINVSERIREIATIKVLGFYNKEVAMYVYRENFILSFMGAVAGLFLGVVLHRVIIKSIEQSYFMFGYVISPLSFVLSVALTLLFSALVMAYMYKKLMNIPMVESLKTVE